MVDDNNNRQTPEDAYIISSTCKPHGSGELKICKILQKKTTIAFHVAILVLRYNRFKFQVKSIFATKNKKTLWLCLSVRVKMQTERAKNRGYHNLDLGQSKLLSNTVPETKMSCIMRKPTFCI